MLHCVRTEKMKSLAGKSWWVEFIEDKGVAACGVGVCCTGYYWLRGLCPEVKKERDARLILFSLFCV